MSDVLICRAMKWTQRQLLRENSPEFVDNLRLLLEKEAVAARQKAAAMDKKG